MEKGTKGPFQHCACLQSMFDDLGWRKGPANEASVESGEEH